MSGSGALEVRKKSVPVDPVQKLFTLGGRFLILLNKLNEGKVGFVNCSVSYHFEYALGALKYLLEKAGETHWTKQVKKSLVVYRQRRDANHHLLAYGGMGSLNDVFLCERAGHNLTREQEPYVNVLFDWLKNQIKILRFHR